MNPEHGYRLSIEWTGNLGTGTSGYRDYARTTIVRGEGKPEIAASADTPFRGDVDRWNPEELLLAALSQCHLLSYLYVAATAGVVVLDYHDEATGTMVQTEDGGGRMTEVTLHPVVTVADPASAELALRLHADANSKCFIAASVNFPVLHEPQVRTAETA